MKNNNTNHSTLKLPSFIRSFLKLFFYLRTIKIRKKEIARLKAIEQVLNIIKQEYWNASIKGEKHKMKIFNISLFTMIVERDISALKFMILFQMDKWEKQFLGRQLSVLLYESTDDFLKLLGKDFREVINELPEKEVLNQRLKEITKELNVFKQKNKSFLQKVRNYCGAHRDKNAYQQLVTIEKIDTNNLFELTAEFMVPVVKLTSYFTDVMRLMTKNYKVKSPK